MWAYGAESSQDRTMPAERRGASRSNCAAAASVLAGFALFLAARPYEGVVGDAALYIGRALATADPNGLGRDILFRTEGQFAFSLWPRLAAALTAVWGSSAAAMGLAAMGLVAWWGALCRLATRLLPWPACGAALLGAAMLPSAYGAFGAFGFAEPAATPRALAEALVLGALACLIERRRRAALGLLAVAALVHPIMALPGLAIWIAVAWRDDARVRVAVLASATAFLGAVMAGLPVAERLFVRIDPDWLAALGQNAYLFPSLWPAGAWSAIATALVTVAFGRHSVSEAARPLVDAIAAVALAGVLVAALLGDAVPLLLVAQAQTWRALWLLAVLAALLLPVVGLAAWRGEAGERLGAVCLGASWFLADRPSAAFGLLALAVILSTWPDTPRLVMLRRRGTRRLEARTTVVRASRRALRALVGTTEGEGRIAARALLAAALLLVIMAIATWDGRTLGGRRLDTGRPDPALARLLPSEPGAVLWLGDRVAESWFLAGRPSWIGTLQGAPMVFSRDLALLWRDRTDRLAAAGLAPRPSAEDIARFCAAPDAPVAIVWPPDVAAPPPVLLPSGDPPLAGPATGHVVLPCRAGGPSALRPGAGPG